LLNTLIIIYFKKGLEAVRVDSMKKCFLMKVQPEEGGSNAEFKDTLRQVSFIITRNYEIT